MAHDDIGHRDTLGLSIRAVQTLPLSEVKTRLSEIADEVDQTHERVYVTRNGRDFVVLISQRDLDSLEATLELLSDGEAVQRVSQAERDVAAGEVTTGERMGELMQQRRADAALSTDSFPRAPPKPLRAGCPSP